MKSLTPQPHAFVLGTVAGGSVAFIALGILFTCFYKCARPRKKEFPVIKGMSFTYSLNPFFR